MDCRTGGWVDDILMEVWMHDALIEEWMDDIVIEGWVYGYMDGRMQ